MAVEGIVEYEMLRGEEMFHAGARGGETRDGAGRAEVVQLSLALSLHDGRLWGRRVARCVQERKPAVGSQPLEAS